MFRKFLFKLYLFFIPGQENNYQPNFLKSNFLIWSLAVLIILKLIVFSVLFYFPKIDFFADLIAALNRMSLIEMTNQERESLGLNSLLINEKLDQAAYLKAQDMMEKDYFSHQSPTGVQPWYWLKKAGYDYQSAGENLAIGFLDSSEVIKAWKDSPSHRDNLLNPNYQEIGIAVLRGDFQGSDATLVVQFLGQPKKERAPAPELAEALEPGPEKEGLIPAEKEAAPVKETEALPAKEEVLEEGAERKEKAALGGEGPQIAAYQPDSQEPTFSFLLFQFLARDYPNLVQKITFYLLILIIIVLLLNIFIKFDIQDKSLILRTILLIFVLILLSIFDKEIIIQLIPHNLII
jgi:hypothetical protein